MPPDSFRFLDSWTSLLPRQGGAVIALAGSGGCTTLLLRVIEAFIATRAGADTPRVLVTQTTAHPVPLLHHDALVEFDGSTSTSSTAWERGPLVWVTGPRLEPVSDRRAGLTPAEITLVSEAFAPDVVVVQAHASCGAPLRQDGVDPVWPFDLRLAILVTPLSVVGRPWNERSVAGARAEFDANGEPRRVSSPDVLDAARGLIETVPAGARPLPFFTGFGSFRDLDGMFTLVGSLWDPPRVPVVCLGELLGDERRDAADLAALDASSREGALRGERVYAVYPAELDGEDGSDESS